MFNDVLVNDVLWWFLIVADGRNPTITTYTKTYEFHGIFFHTLVEVCSLSYLSHSLQFIPLVTRWWQLKHFLVSPPIPLEKMIIQSSRVSRIFYSPWKLVKFHHQPSYPLSRPTSMPSPQAKPPYGRRPQANQYRITVVDVTAVPRITIAQKLDVLSSQAKVAGHRAVLEAVWEIWTGSGCCCWELEIYMFFFFFGLDGLRG